MSDIIEEFEIAALFEGLEPMQDKRVAVIIGRFNPPQLGHYKLISDVQSWIKSHASLKLETLPVVVVIGGSKSDADLKRNPLSVADRISYMQSSGKCNGVKFFQATNAFAALEAVRKAGLEPIAVAAGSDRMDGYITMLDKYYKDTNDNPIKHYKIELSRADAAVETNKDKKHDSMVAIINKMRDGSDPKVDEISASLARVAVELGAKDEFAKLVGLEHNTKLASNMYAKIKSAMES